MRILFIEDTVPLAEAVRDHLVADGHAVDWVVLLKDASAAYAAQSYDLILLDLHVPDGFGLDWLSARRAEGVKTPVIILTARDQISDRIRGLNAGADDYLVKPFDLDELLARCHAVSRRRHGHLSVQWEIGDVLIDEGAHQVVVGGQAVDLTAREWGVLSTLVQRRGQVVSKRVLEDALYAFGEEVESNAVEVYVSRLRKKLGHTLIRTQRGLGYQVVVS